MIFLPRVTAIWSSELNLPTPIHFTLVILNRLVFTLAIYLTTFSLPWFMDLTFQVAMPYCSLQHQVLFSPPDTSINEHHFHFSPAASFFLELLVIALLSFSVAYATHSDLRSSSSDVVSFFFNFQTVPCVLAARIPEWFSIPSPSGAPFVRTLHYGLSWMALHGMAQSFLSYTRPFFTTRLWSMKRKQFGTLHKFAFYSAYIPVNLLCKHDWAKDYPDRWLNTVSGHVPEGVSGRD